MDENTWNDKWKFLRPWCQEGLSWRLRYVRGMIQDVPGRHLNAIRVQLPSGNGSNQAPNKHETPIHDVRETLGLFAAVAHIDKTLWKKLLLQCTDLDLRNEEAAADKEMFVPRFQLAVADNQSDYDYHLLTGIMEFCGTAQCTSRSPAYNEALATVLAMNDNNKSWTVSMEIEIPITVQLEPWITDSSQDMLTYLQKLLETVRAIRTQWQQFRHYDQSSLGVVFVLESITVDLRDLCISTDLAEVVESLARDGIRVSGLALRQDEFEGTLASNGNLEEARITVGKLMFGLFGGAKPMTWEEFSFEATSITGPLVAEYGHVNQLASRSVHFDCDTMQNWVFERMCSAIAVNQTTRHLSLRLELDGGESDDQDENQAYSCWRWQWIIFACFSEKARLHSRLQSLALHNAVITTEAIKSMAAVLAADGPEEHLLGYSCCSSDGLIDTCIKAGSPIELLSIRMEHSTPHRGLSFTLDREIAGVRQMITRDENDCAMVLVPGFGRCRVHRQHLVYRKLTLASTSLAGITSLAIQFTDDPDPEVLHGLLLLIGVSLTHLVLQLQDFHTSELNHIVTTCPNLLELVISTHPIEMRLCFYDKHKYRDVLSHHTKASVSFSRIKEIAATLCDETNFMTKYVRRLRVHMKNPVDECSNAFLLMLKKNSTLEYLDVIVTSPTHTKSKYVSKFQAHHLKPLGLEKSAFPIKCKIAFLSVMTIQEHVELTKRRKAPVTMFPVLDHHVLRRIFEYARPHVFRQVYFHEYTCYKTRHMYIPS